MTTSGQLYSAAVLFLDTLLDDEELNAMLTARTRDNFIEELAAAVSSRPRRIGHRHDLSEPTVYSEHWVDKYIDEDFKRHFRLSRERFTFVLNVLITEGLVGAKSWSVEPKKTLEIAIWYLGNQDSMGEISEKFEVSTTTVFNCRNKVCSILARLSKRFIQWPCTPEDIERTESEFKELAGFPGVVGAIDGSHVKIQAPSVHETEYINRKMFHSVNLQGICNARGKFTNVYIGSPGSMHDTQVLQNSQVYQLAEELFPSNKHLLGDSSYLLKSWLLVPYRDHGNLSHMERRYNERLNETRVIIENTFDNLKNRFRRLLIGIDANPKFVTDIIHACCVLHNICQDDEDQDQSIIFEEKQETLGNDDDDDDAIDIRAAEGDESGRMKRREMAQYMMLPDNIRRVYNITRMK